MRTQKVTLFHEVTHLGIKPPALRETERKDRWVKEVQKSVEVGSKPLYIKTTYELHNPEIERQRRFFNGTCVKYYAIQNMDMTVGVPDSATIKKYREELLDEMLGYDVALITRTIRERKSTTDFRSVQAWSKFLNLLQETLFDSAGYDFPSSEDFWLLAHEYGYDQAERISIEQLQARMKLK